MRKAVGDTMLDWSFSACTCAAHRGAGMARRRFLAQAAGMAGAAATGGAVRAAAPAGPRAIDLHHHYFPKAQAEATQKYFVRPPRPNTWSPARSLEEMDKYGIGAALLSLQLPGVWLGGAENSRKLARVCNDEGAQIVRDNPRRFGLLAALPVPDPDGALAELAYAFDTLKADGIGLMTSYDGKYLGDPAFTPVLDGLNRRKAVCFVHPNIAACCANVVPGVDEGAIEYATDTTRTMASLLFNGAAERFPDIRFIFAHSGGTFPYLTERMVHEGARRPAKSSPDWPLPVARRFYYEMAQGHEPGQFAALMKLVPTSRVLFGTDYPFRSASESVDGLANYPFTAAELASLKRGLAATLFPRLAGA